MLALLSPLSLETDHGQENIYQTLLGRDDRPRDFTAVHLGVRRKTEQLGGKRRIRHGELYKATTVEQIQQFVRKQNKLKVLGTRHCFNRIADSNNQFISVREINHVISIDPEARTATVEGGISYGELGPYLDSKGWALHDLASLPHISVAGAIATATHGSGEKNGNLSTAVSGLEIVNGAGDIVRLSREKDGETFRGSVIGLGA
jgi:xylitol oxidase